MTRSADGTPRPSHLVLAPAIPIVALLRGNLKSTQPDTALFPLLVALAVALVLWGIASRFTRDRLGSALAVSVTMLAATSYGSIVRAGQIVAVPMLGPIATFLAVLIAFRMLRLGQRAAAFTTFANTALGFALLFLVLPIAWTEWQRPVLATSNPPIQTGPSSRRPDVYVLILDGYGRQDVLRSFGFENGLVSTLRNSGFFVANEAWANYSQTVHSLASALNMRYLAELLGSADRSRLTRRSIADLIRTSSFLQVFSQAGYRVQFYRSEYGLIRPGAAAELREPRFAVNQFDLAIYEGTILPELSRLTGLTRGALPLAAHRRQVRWTFDDLLGSVAEQRAEPSLFFAHVLAPHPPFAFNADGSDRKTTLPALMADGDHWHAMADGSGEDYVEGYLATLRFVNARVQQLVQAILARSDREAIIYIQGDHGPGSRLRFDDPSSSDLTERFGIMLALRLPGRNQDAMHPGITPVNAFRAIANAALGTNLPLLEDRSYFVPWTRPFEFIDVTSQLVGCDPQPEGCDTANQVSPRQGSWR
jgi:hypothetical protein